MTELLLEPARRSGCDNLPAVSELLKASALRQKSPIDDLLDAAVVDEESYLRELANELDIPWLESITNEENTLPLREACRPRIALKHRLLPVSIEGEGDQKKLILATFDPFNLVALLAAAQDFSMPFEWRRA